MSRLKEVMMQNGATSEGKEKGRKGGGKKSGRNVAVPLYDMSGKAVMPERKRRKARAACFLLLLSVLAGFIYLPQFIIKDTGDVSGQKESGMDSASIRLSNNALRDNPNEDFDGDGLSNAEEERLGTDPWEIDTDGDGATDYCEAHVTNTNPTVKDGILVDAQTKQDEQKGKKVSSPYKIGNVILWADDYESKALGSVAETENGYRFCGFNGYVQFCGEPDSYAYRLHDGVRTLLPYRKNENVWKVADGDFVELHKEKLKEIIEFSFFNHALYADSDKITDILAKILPDRGFITAVKKTDMDVEPDIRDNVETEIKRPSFDSSDLSRFMDEGSTLNDLQRVRESISEQESCVAISLFNAKKGERIALVYGYTSDGGLLLADINTLKPAGILAVTEKARKIMDETGALVSYPYFDFEGFGFSSSVGDRISFFAFSEDTIPGQEGPDTADTP